MTMFWLLLAFTTIISSAKGLVCHECINARSMSECSRTGRLRTCEASQGSCMIEIRNNLGSFLLTKQCKQTEACNNMHRPEDPEAPVYTMGSSVLLGNMKPVECSANHPNKVCKCCCEMDRCNAATFYCLVDGTPPKPPPPPPTCQPLIGVVENGKVVCSKGFSEHNALGSTCRVQCEYNYELSDPDFSTSCKYSSARSSARWTKSLPECLPKKCNFAFDLLELENGEVMCDDETQSCEYECTTESYFLYPPHMKENRCQDGDFHSFHPCCITEQQMKDACTKPFDLVVILDSSSSVMRENWEKQISFVQSTITNIDNKGAQYGVFRYNAKVDTATEIPLSQKNNLTELFEAMDNIPYDGSGTFTGAALQHAYTQSFQTENGNREGVKDIILLVTDGNASDDTMEISKEILGSGAVMYAIGIGLDSTGEGNIKQIVGHNDRYVNVVGGFLGLSRDISEKIKEVICDPCGNIQ